MAERFFSLKPLSISQIVELDETQSHHLLHVMRATIGQEVRLFDGGPQEYLAEVATKDRRHVRLRVTAPWSLPQPAPPRLVVAAPVPKGDRFRFLLEKLTELGVPQYVPLITQRSVNQYTGSLEKKAHQWVIEACKQAGRNTLLDLAAACSVDHWLATVAHVPERILASLPVDKERQAAAVRFSPPPLGGDCPSTDSPGSTAATPATVATTAEHETDGVEAAESPGTTGHAAGPVSQPAHTREAPPVAEAVVAVGPEGGFTPEEIRQFLDSGFRPWTIGPFVLRMETAAIAAAAQWIAAQGGLLRRS